MAEQTVPWRTVFGDDRPVEVEIGPGRGDVLVAFARNDPSHGFFGIERSSGIADAIVARAAAIGLTNVRAIGGDARCIVTSLIPAGSVAAYHIYFPDPWPKTRHRHRKLFDGGFGAALRRTLRPGGLLFVATDLAHLLEEMSRAIAAAGFDPAPDVRPRIRPQTKFERKYGRGGTYAGVWRRPPADATATDQSAAAGSPSPQKNS